MEMLILLRFLGLCGVDGWFRGLMEGFKVLVRGAIVHI